MDSFSESREKLHSNVLLLKKDPIKCHIPKQRVCVNCENCSQSVTDKNATEICYGQTHKGKTAYPRLLRDRSGCIKTNTCNSGQWRNLIISSVIYNPL